MEKPVLHGTFRSENNRWEWDADKIPTPQRSDVLPQYTEHLPVLCDYCGMPFWPLVASQKEDLPLSSLTVQSTEGWHTINGCCSEMCLLNRQREREAMKEDPDKARILALEEQVLEYEERLAEIRNSKGTVTF